LILFKARSAAPCFGDDVTNGWHAASVWQRRRSPHPGHSCSGSPRRIWGDHGMELKIVELSRLQFAMTAI